MDEYVVRSLLDMRALVQDSTLLAIITLLTVVYAPLEDFAPLLVSVVAQAPLLRLVRFGTYYGVNFGRGDNHQSLAMRVFLGRLVLQQGRHVRLYVELRPSSNLRYLRRELGCFTARHVLVHALMEDRSVVDFVQDRYQVLAFIMGSHRRLSQRQGGEVSPVFELDQDIYRMIAEFIYRD
jgi:hypothetical protein